jgi:hypothetical protein
MNGNENRFDACLCSFESSAHAEAIVEVSIVESRSEKAEIENFGQDTRVALVTYSIVAKIENVAKISNVTFLWKHSELSETFLSNPSPNLRIERRVRKA